MKLPMTWSRLKIALVMVGLGWGTPANASTCDIGQWIGGIEFGACPTQTGLELNRILAERKQRAAFRFRMTQRFKITVAQYNADFPLIYAQWQREQNLIASTHHSQSPSLPQASVLAKLGTHGAEE